MINIDTELRKLRPAELYNLGLILNPSDNWKKLMASVTKEGSENIPKFPGEYISIVEQAARQERKLAAAIFLEEWATMGKKRPTVGLLLDLLMKTELFRAADYLAQDILKVSAPQRPSSGPAAPVDIEAIAEMLLHQNLVPESSESSTNSDFCKRTTNEIRLSQINYPSDIFDSTNDDNIAVDDNEIGVINMQYAESSSNQVLDAAKIANNSKSSKDDYQSHYETMIKIESKSSKQIFDLIKFSANDNENSTHQIKQSQSSNKTSNLIKFSANDSKNFKQYSQSDLLKFDSEKINPNEEIELCDAIIPNLSLLRLNSSSKDDFKENANYAEAINVEMTSAELPVCLGRFGNSAESSANVDETAERDNQNFHRELVSAELPLCINDRIDINTEKSNFSVLSSESIDNESSESLEIVSEENMDSNSVIPCFVIDAGRKKKNEEKNENAQHEPEKNVLNSMELPITVLEFHKR